MERLMKQGCSNPWCVSRLCSNNYLNTDDDKTSQGLDKNEAFVNGLKLAKDSKFVVESEKCSVRPIYGEEIGVILRVLKEEQKEPSRDEIITRLKEVFSDPFSLAASFYPIHLKPSR